jgi:hypothetical protein
MLDLFGGKRKAILALPEFQNIVSVSKDFKAIVRGMSDEFCIVNVTPKIHLSETYIELEFSAVIENSYLRHYLNKYYDMLYGSRPFAFRYNYATHSSMSEEELQQLQKRAHLAENSIKETYLDTIRQIIFQNDSSHALYEHYKDFGYTDVEDLIYYGFGIPDTYSPSDDEHIPFTRSFSFRTGLSDNDSNGRFKNEYSRKEEMTYYAEILMSQL